MIFRSLKSEDIPAALSLCRHAEWNQVARDWNLFLQTNPFGCQVAEANDKVIGTFTTISYQDKFSWVGMVLVDPVYRHRGIGTELMNRALLLLENQHTIKLDASPAGRLLYLKLGFEDEYSLTRMTMSKANKMEINSSIRPMNQKDLSKINALDFQFFGADRWSLLEYQWQGAPQYAFVSEEEHGIQGYCMGRQGYEYIQLGPVIARDINIAKELVTSALHACTSQPVIIDVLLDHSEWISWLQSIGFNGQRPFYRMYKGENRFPGEPNKQYAIFGPEVG